MHFPGHTLSSSFRRSAAEYLGAVFLELFPQARLLGGGETPLGFYYEVEVGSPFREELLPIVEQKLCSFLKDERKLQGIEMMRENAVSMLLHFQQPVLAEQVRAQETNIVSLVQMGKYRGVPTGQLERDITSIQSVKLLELLPSKKYPKGIRIEGAIFSDPAEKKQFLKGYRNYFLHRDHRILGEEMGLFRLHPEENSFVWYPKGVLFKQRIRQVIDGCLCSSGWDFLPVEMEGPGDARRRHYQLWEKETKPWGLCACRGVLDRSGRVRELLQDGGFLGRRGQECFSIRAGKNEVWDLSSSLLQRIEAWVRMLGLNAYWRGSGNWQGMQLPWEIVRHTPKHAFLPNKNWIELCVFDLLGRTWPGPFLEAIPLQEDWVLFGDWLGGIEQIAVLVLEQAEGPLPWTLAPEQVRILSADAASLAYTLEIGEICQREGVLCEVDVRPSPLKQRVFEAEKAKIRYLLLVGEKERKMAQVMVRSGHRQKMYELREFLTLVKGEGRIV